jgi:thiol:disulfide interchange protein DsbD
MLSIRTVSLALATAAVTATVAFAGGANFKPVKSVAELDQAIAEAKKAGKRVMMDFTADWCVPCKKMEKQVFTDAAVQKALEGYVFLQADVTKMNADDKALMQRFEVKGPPVIAFWDAKGNELKKCKVTGFTPAPKFSAHIETCTKS